MQYSKNGSSEIPSTESFDAIHRSRSCFTKNTRFKVDKKHGGFSLTELMVVMVILGMLATATALAMRGYSDSARRTKVVTEIATYVNAIDAFYAVQGRYPTNDEGLAILTAKTKNSPSGYVKKLTKDPWGHPYVYQAPGTKKDSPFEIICYGADGKEGGAETNADISSENLEND